MSAEEDEVEQDADLIDGGSDDERKNPVSQVAQPKNTDDNEEEEHAETEPEPESLNNKAANALAGKQSSPPLDSTTAHSTVSKSSNFGKYSKPKKSKILLPSVIPWENTKAKETQKGMGAFGHMRNPVTKVDHGVKGLPENKEGEGILTAFAEMNKFASQKGTSGFGGPRKNVVKTTGGKDIPKERLQPSEGIIPRQSGCNDTPSQKGQTPMGAIRKQVIDVAYRRDMISRMDAESSTFMAKLMAPNPNSKAGSAVIDKSRKTVPKIQGDLPNDKRSLTTIPLVFDRSKSAQTSAIGTGVHGPFRQVVTPVTGGYDLTSDDIIESKKVIPWATAPSASSQEGTGGFHKIRDVVNHAKYQW